MENTSATIDLDIEGLNKELAKIVNTFREEKLMNAAPADVYRDVVEDVEKFCNGNKYSIRKLYETLNQACTVSEALSNHISPIDFVETEDSRFFSDNDCRMEIYESCSAKIASYYADLQHTTLSHNIISSRMSTLRRMLYKEAESTVKEAVREKIFVYKSKVIEEIDNRFCLGMSQHQFDVEDALKARELLKSIIVIGQNARSLLIQSKYNEQILLNAAFDEICFYVENCIRRVQLAFSLHSSEALDLLMDLEVDDTNHDDIEVIADANSSSSSSGNGLLARVPVADGRDLSENDEDEDEEEEEEEQEEEEQKKLDTVKALVALGKKQQPSVTFTPAKASTKTTAASNRKVSAKAVIEVEPESESEEEEQEEEESDEESEPEPVLTRSAIKAAATAGSRPATKVTTVVTVTATPSRSSLRGASAPSAPAAVVVTSTTNNKGNDRKRKEPVSSSPPSPVPAKRVQHSRQAKKQ